MYEYYVLFIGSIFFLYRYINFKLKQNVIFEMLEDPNILPQLNLEQIEFAKTLLRKHKDILKAINKSKLLENLDEDDKVFKLVSRDIKFESLPKSERDLVVKSLKYLIIIEYGNRKF